MRVRRRVKWGECDPAGVVYAPRFCDYVVEAQDAFMGHLLGIPLQQRLAELDLGTPAKALQLVFHSSLRPEQAFDMHVFVSGIRVRSFDLLIEAQEPEGTRLFSARFSAVCVHHTVRESRPLPLLLRERLETYQARYPVGHDEFATAPSRLARTADAADD